MSTSVMNKSAPVKALPEAQINTLLSLRCVNPHEILGAHAENNGIVVRAYRPEAESIQVLFTSAKEKKSAQMERIHSSGLFEVFIPKISFPFSYDLEVQYPGGNTFTFRDPYEFLPTLGDLDVYLASEGRHENLWEKLGAHPLNMNHTEGVAFALWAPHAEGVSVIGDFNNWDGRLHCMRRIGASGIWEIFLPDVSQGARYKYEIRTNSGQTLYKTDPFAQAMENPPQTASVVFVSDYDWSDRQWMHRRGHSDPWKEACSIYEMHLGSWQHRPEEGHRPLSYRELAPVLTNYLLEMGFTHVEFLPVMEHPFSGSWGYQVSGYFAPTSRFGSPDDFRFLVDYLHQHNIGVIVDWVPAHFPKDAFALGRFDGTALFEHLDPRQGEHPDWGTFVFNFGRREVKNFLMASALHWLSEYHIDGLRVDAVASMLYLDYSRQEGQWVPNQHGGRENLEAIEFLKEVNAVCHRRHPGILMIAEESTAWPKVSQATEQGGLGFGFKWNMGWMHDTLEYFAKDSIYRKYHHHMLTFGLQYAFSENFILPISHDEVVHGKGSMLGKMPGDTWQKFANLRAFYAWMWAHPGKKMLFMGCEFGQDREWNHDQSLDWHLLSEGIPGHRGLLKLISDLNRNYRNQASLWQCDFTEDGFIWLDTQNADNNIFAFIRKTVNGDSYTIVIANLSPSPKDGYRVGLPKPGAYQEILNSDAEIYGGSNMGNYGWIHSENINWQGQPCSASVTLPPLGVIWLVSEAADVLKLQEVAILEH